MRTSILIMATVVGVAILSGCSTTKKMSGKVTPYPLDTCMVTDNDLGSMGDPISIVHKGQEIKFCCKPCIGKFTANPKQYLLRLATKAK